MEEVNDGVSDVTVSSVHTSDLSSFEEEEYSDIEEEPSQESIEGKGMFCFIVVFQDFCIIYSYFQKFKSKFVSLENQE